MFSVYLSDDLAAVRGGTGESQCFQHDLRIKRYITPSYGEVSKQIKDSRPFTQFRLTVTCVLRCFSKGIFRAGLRSEDIFISVIGREEFISQIS